MTRSTSTGGHPRCFVSYETFLDDWRGGGRQGRNRAGDRMAGGRHAGGGRYRQLFVAGFAAPCGDALPSSTAIRKSMARIKEVYHALLQLERGKSAEAIAKLDRIKAEFETQTAVFGEATLPELAERERSLNEEIDKAVEWGSPKSVARRAWIQVKQVIKDVYESFRFRP